MWLNEGLGRPRPPEPSGTSAPGMSPMLAYLAGMQLFPRHWPDIGMNVVIIIAVSENVF